MLVLWRQVYYTAGGTNETGYRMSNAQIDGDNVTFSPNGRLDGTNSREFEESVLSRLRTPEQVSASGQYKVLIDMGGLEYVSSAGLRAILLIAKTLRSQQSELALCKLSPRIREVFKISGFDRIVPIHETRESAFSQFSG
ncbi:MAG: STAS domain-containing protein [Rhodobacteraceae bacterium]|nr:STAS domain-containing protein [Paracoccaceae bacterium]